MLTKRSGQPGTLPARDDIAGTTRGLLSAIRVEDRADVVADHLVPCRLGKRACASRLGYDGAGPHAALVPAPGGMGRGSTQRSALAYVLMMRS